MQWDSTHCEKYINISGTLCQDILYDNISDFPINSPYITAKGGKYMYIESIPLQAAIPGREYIIDHIRRGKSYTDTLRGYGIFPGTKIKLLFKSPAKDPSAYEVMGAVLALRREDSEVIYVSPVILHQPGHTFLGRR